MRKDYCLFWKAICWVAFKLNNKLIEERLCLGALDVALYGAWNDECLTHQFFQWNEKKERIDCDHKLRLT